MFLGLVKLILIPFMLVYWRPKVYGYRNLFIKGKAILACNHISMVDPVLIELLSPRLVHFMAKAELFKSRFQQVFFGWLCAFPVNRKEPDVLSIQSALHVLNRGQILGIFPEGKRSVTYELDQFERGTAFLALRSGAPVVPIYIDVNSYQKWHRARLIVGTALSVDDLPDRPSAAIGVFTDKLRDAMLALRANLEEIDARAGR